MAPAQGGDAAAATTAAATTGGGGAAAPAPAGGLPPPAAATTAADGASSSPTFDLGGGEVLPVPADVAPLFRPLTLGPFRLSNRIVYAPLTRMRAQGFVPQPIMATYYGQRAVPGTLFISEATNISEEALGYMNSPGVFTREQTEAWRPVVAAVRGRGAVFFCQLWHCGRASHSDLQPGGAAPISSSTRRITSPEYTVFTQNGAQPYPSPRAATREDIARIVQQYAAAAKAAVHDAGFDGVEIHGANGYLIDQFIKDSINDRTDEYGGSIENRCRFCLEVVAAVAAAVGPERVGLRLSPFTSFLDAHDSTPYATHTYLLEKLNGLGLAYIHMVEPRIMGPLEVESHPESLAPFRRVYKGVFIAAGGFKADSGARALAQGEADLVAYGRWYLANPDLHRRFLTHAPLNKYHRDTFYSSGPEGYIDYPTLAQQREREAIAA
ncbi:hypothetical protein HYH03_004342 [Edaphochlamys debaryana]|uniref:NADH:flavin oxidoreductase/NADH oxidase N-terminal domain-containing protein n=1 Tax=Edaphochlamys debaryana TaxID=47281 RepID=A0A835Y790_9CHLO|nr:hypothetical protein HYH03_004342 [Edaphochlamys debaryana]|eukprot:KAG2497597.1 hypothetical protein HYH03_004342 [Edaphochlamys debaryana]